MNSGNVDTLLIFDRLKKSFTDEQAHVISEIIKDVHEENLKTVATKADLKYELKELELQLTNKIKELELHLTIRMGVIIAAAVAMLAAIIKFKG